MMLRLGVSNQSWPMSIVTKFVAKGIRMNMVGQPRTDYYMARNLRWIVRFIKKNVQITFADLSLEFQQQFFSLIKKKLIILKLDNLLFSEFRKFFIFIAFISLRSIFCRE